MSDAITGLDVVGQFFAILLFLVPIVLISRLVVAGSRFSPILIVVILGLGSGFLLEFTGISTPGLANLPFIDLMAGTTIIALVVSFFVGGQELRKILSKKSLEEEADDIVDYSGEKPVAGTTRTQFFFILRAFLLLLGIQTLMRAILGTGNEFQSFYPFLAVVGLFLATFLLNNKARFVNKKNYVQKGIIEVIGIVIVLFGSFHISGAVESVIALPQIFFAMMISAAFGALAYNYVAGPTLRALLFAGIPVVLAANFLVGGSRISEAFAIPGVNAVLVYGFFGQLLWMFGGIALIMFFAKTANARNLAPGMAGALSHSGLTGACTAGDFGKTAASRAPIMINIPFFGHIFVFSILAVSAEREALWIGPAMILVVIGIGLTAFALANLRKANNEDRKEVTALMQFSFGWQIVAVFGGLSLLSLSSLAMDYSAMAQASAISHFGLFAAIQEGMFGTEASLLIPFIFSMPFLVHPIVFYMFGKAMERDGEMPVKPVYVLAAIGLVGALVALVL